MSATLLRTMLMACLLSSFSLWPSGSWALGLGEIHLNSALNEPLNADIDLIAATPDELIALRATLADREAFTRYGIDRPAFLSTLTFKVGKGKDGRDALLVRSTDAIPEPFVTFLVEVNWARGRLMREYTVLLDPPVYTPGETPSTAAPVAAASSAAAKPHRPAAAAVPEPTTAVPTPPTTTGAALPASAGTTSYRVAEGDTLMKIARSLRSEAPANLDQTMIALYRSNPEAFGGNINVLRRGAVLRVPGADQIAALNQNEAMNAVHRQMSAWRETGGAAPAGGHLRLVTPSGSSAGTGPSNASGGANGSNAANAENQALKDRVKDLESQLAETHRLIDVRNTELSELQRKLGASAAKPATPAPAVTAAPPPTAPSAAQQPASAPTPTALPPAETTSNPTPLPTPAPVKKKPVVVHQPVESGSWIDWLAANWWLPAAILFALVLGIVVAAVRRRKQSSLGDLGRMEATDVAELRDPTSKLAALRKGDDSFVVEESGPHRMPEFGAAPDRFGDTAADVKAPDDTMSSESAVNLDQGDPLAEADFHMAYGLYDQAADLVRIHLFADLQEHMGVCLLQFGAGLGDAVDLRIEGGLVGFR